MKKVIIGLSTILLSIFFVKSVYAQTQIINSNQTLAQDTVWQDKIILDGARVTIAENTTLTIKPGTLISGKNGGSLFVLGKLKALGEKDKKIRFTKEKNDNPNFSLTYYIDSSSTSEIDLDNFILENGGGNKDIASLPALTIKGKATLNNGIIRRNIITAIRVWSNDVKIEDCEIYENESIALENKSTTNTLKIEDNWWGSVEGPTTSALSNNPRALIKGAIDFDPWQKKGPIPIIILPGFGGSFSFKLFSSKAKDEWWLPAVGTPAYRYFAKALILNNYYHDKDFFWGFYDWRISCEESAKKYLKEIIETAMKNSGHSQVNIVAHSMGGLVARSYIQGEDFRDDIDQLVTAGTPHLGSSETYPIWEGGKLLDEKKPIYLYLWYLEALKWDWNSVELIQENFPSIGEMLPIYDYLTKDSDGILVDYKEQKEQNKFLRGLASPIAIEKLNQRATVSLIVGKGEETLKTIRVKKYGGEDKRWLDGIPEPINPPKDTTNGDGTVTFESASADNTISKNISIVYDKHSQLLKTGAKPIFEQLKVQAKFPILYKLMNRFLLTTKGPVNVAIKDEEGKILNNSKNELDDSSYHEEDVENQKLTYSDFAFDPSSNKTIILAFKGNKKDNLKAAFWNFSQDDYQKEDIDLPLSRGMEINYTIALKENAIEATPEMSLKNLMVFVNRLYEENKISNWDTRSQLIDSLAEAYQYKSNDHIDDAKNNIVSALNILNSSSNDIFSDNSYRDLLSQNLSIQKEKPQ